MVPKEQNERGFRLDRSRDKKRNKAGERKRRWIQTTERSSTREKSVRLVKSGWNGRPVFLKQISTRTSDEASDIFDNSCALFLQLGRQHIFIWNKRPQSTDFRCWLFREYQSKQQDNRKRWKKIRKRKWKVFVDSCYTLISYAYLFYLIYVSITRKITYNTKQCKCWDEDTNKYCYTKFRQVYAQTYKYTLATNT